MSSDATEQPHLKRVLGRWDLVLLFVVAVFNLNVVPSIAANGGVTVWLWLISLLLFFWPQGIAVIELSHRYPGEGGVYLWAKEVFGDFHGFFSGWCYWTNNMMYVPTVMLLYALAAWPHRALEEHGVGMSEHGCVRLERPGHVLERCRFARRHVRSAV